ncbi:MAG: hypothetical protein JWN73_3872 [Betaproteobacteria bacterium]|nr:hypothetical protein [Betaproteobacteria bacterium]
MVPQGDFFFSGSNTNVLRLKPLAAALRKGLSKMGLGGRQGSPGALHAVAARG